ncbi:hypothetical protein MPNT_100039 [Candidatus Methylacidithermus pantelleriae]|uniref:Uncharacterized protein n=1 Tax=Candidatus Methylacidithermus pantelleriae TaxID=2744239 RepID=A0A8J2FMX8_9BACT|nr:hypothetical protein MPNT_100039 [Candidatus Methylacidithermus pantelleriae]
MLSLDPVLPTGLLSPTRDWLPELQAARFCHSGKMTKAVVFPPPANPTPRLQATLG